MVDLDLTDPDLYTGGIPHDVFRALRADEPIALRHDSTGKPYWAVTRYHDVVHVLKHPEIYSSWRGGVLLDDPPPEFLSRLRENMLNRDPPEHTRMRRLVSQAFSSRRLASLERTIAQHARELVGRMRGRERCDFATEIAGAMPLFVICEILGVPHEDREMLYGFTARMFGSDIADRTAALEDGMAAAAEMRTYGAELGRRKVAAPADDLVSDLLAAEIDGRRLTDGEFEAFFMLLFNAGSDTTRSLLCYGLDLLLDRPHDLQLLREAPTLLPGAIEEMLRFESPVIQFRRTATCDHTFGGRQLHEGDRVVVFFPSANRDDSVFPDPDRFDLARTPNHHLAFGHGTHFCLGAQLARLEARHVFRETFAQLHGLRRAAPIVTSRTNFIRSIRHQEIAFNSP